MFTLPYLAAKEWVMLNDIDPYLYIGSITASVSDVLSAKDERQEDS